MEKRRGGMEKRMKKSRLYNKIEFVQFYQEINKKNPTIKY